MIIIQGSAYNLVCVVPCEKEGNAYVRTRDLYSVLLHLKENICRLSLS